VKNSRNAAGRDKISGTFRGFGLRSAPRTGPISQGPGVDIAGMKFGGDRGGKARIGEERQEKICGKKVAR
jgi:hypothetical protein